MNIIKKELPKSGIELTVSIPYEDIQKDLADAAQEISAKHRVEGFRPGKVPFDILKQKFGEQYILEHALEGIVQRSFVRAILDENLETVGQPSINVTKTAPGNPIEYTATVALLPDAKLPDYKTVRADHREITVSDADVEKTILDIRKVRATETRAERPAKEGDKIEVDFRISVDKVPIDGGQSKNHPVYIGEKNFIPGFEEGLIGMKAGETKIYPVHFPENYHAKHLSGKEAEAQVTMQAVYDVNIPAADEMFAKGLGDFATMDDVRKKIRENLLEEAMEQEVHRYQAALIDDVVEKTIFGEIPDILIERETEKMLGELEQRTTQRGMDFENYLKSIKRTREELRKDFVSDAERRVKAALVLRGIAQAEKITITLDELQEEKNKYLAGLPDTRAIREQVQTPAFDDYLSNIISNRKVFGILQSYAEKTVPTGAANPGKS